MKHWYIVLLVFLSFSCQKVEKVEKPANLLSEGKMVEVLTDVSLLNSAKNFNRRMLEETGLQPKEFLYQKHNIDSLALAESTKYYSDDPATLERIYNKVQKKLESLKVNLEEIRAEEVRIQDSINAVKEREGDSLKIDVDSLQLKQDSLVPVQEFRSDTLIPVRQSRRDTLMPIPKRARNRNM